MKTHIKENTIREMDKATLHFLLPFGGWCVMADRGVHRHYNLLNLREAIKFRNRVNDHTCRIYCPKCDTELISSDSYYGHKITEKGEYYSYVCKNCQWLSHWDFDTYPAPVISEIH